MSVFLTASGSIDDIENLTGIEFLKALPDSKEMAVEKSDAERIRWRK